MNPTRLLPLLKLCFMFLMSSLVLDGCATSGIVDHSFCFQNDNQNVAILDFRYGGPEDFAYATPEFVKRGHEFHADCVGGPMPLGDFLYVKWRDKATNKIYEDNVDLRHRLPRRMEGKKITFMIKGQQLYVYVVDEHKLRGDMPKIGPWMYQGFQVIMIYPDQSKS